MLSTKLSLQTMSALVAIGASIAIPTRRSNETPAQRKGVRLAQSRQSHVNNNPEIEAWNANVEAKRKLKKGNRHG
jgi:hypothetical protein